MPYTIHTIAEVVNGQIYGTVEPEFPIRFLLTDSRRLVYPLHTAFFALKSTKNDGHRYIKDLIRKGAKCFVVSSLPKENSTLNSAAFILVDDTLAALQKIAAFHRSEFNLPVIGITGSNGKTIVKEWLSQLLGEMYSIVKSPRSYNSQTGVPLSVWQMDSSHQIAIFEAGISRPGEMEKLAQIIRPDSGIFTNIGPAHDEGFTGLEQKIHEKLRLFHNSSSLVYHCDNQLLDQCIRNWARGRDGITLYRWGVREDADIRVNVTGKTLAEQQVSLVWKEKEYHYDIPFGDEASFENAIHCIVYIITLGHGNGWLAAKVPALQPIAMRMELKQAINNCSLINDTYNSDISSLAIALDFLNAQVQHKDKLLVLSDILQTGVKPEKLYKDVASLLKEKKITHLIGIGKEISGHRECFRDIVSTFYPDTDDFMVQYDFSRFSNQAILLKGARDFGFERISRKLQLKDHQTLLEINLDALVHNLNIYRSLLKPGVKIMAMVKAFSYGSGSYEIANVMQFHQVDYLAVAFADEGSELRNAGITIPILVLNPELHNLDVLFRYNLEPEIYSLSLLRRIGVELQRFDGYNESNPFPVHIKLDTGMHRLGFMTGETNELIATLKEFPVIRVATVFSHLAASDRVEFDEFTKQQINLFESLCSELEKGQGYNFLKHIANTSAISRFPESQYDIVRLGIGMYGIDGNSEIESGLQNVTTFRSVISQVKDLPAGETVGYNRAGKLSRDTRLAIVPAGYADGLDRRMGNGKGYVMINGRKAPFVGNISMDMCAVDITGIDAAPGDEVIIFGEAPSINELSLQLGTIPYEILTSIPPRVKRIYYQE